MTSRIIIGVTADLMNELGTLAKGYNPSSPRVYRACIVLCCAVRGRSAPAYSRRKYDYYFFGIELLHGVATRYRAVTDSLVFLLCITAHMSDLTKSGRGYARGGDNDRGTGSSQGVHIASRKIWLGSEGEHARPLDIHQRPYVSHSPRKSVSPVSASRRHN